MGKDLKGKELGEGICQIKDGRYVARYTDRYGQRKSIYGHKLKEVKEKYNKAIYMRDIGADDISIKRITVNELYRLWVAEKSRTLRASTLASNESFFHRNVLPIWGDVLITGIHSIDIQALCDELANSCMPNTVRSYITRLHGFFAYAKKGGYILQNPCQDITVRQTSDDKNRAAAKKASKFLTQDQLRRLLDYADIKAPKIVNLCRLISLTGMRIGEAMGLTWDDVDWDAGAIRITKTFSKASCHTVRCVRYDQAPKTQASLRTVPLCAEAKEALKRQRQSKFTSDTLVFTKDRGEPYRSEALSSAFKELTKKYNENELAAARREGRRAELVPEFAIHILRHTFASLCFAQGIEPKIVQGYLGHSTLAMTMDTYTHVNAEKQFNEINKLNGLL